jgi:hypothetical protein
VHKRSSLLQTFESYNSKTFCNIVPDVIFTTLHFLRDLKKDQKLESVPLTSLASLVIGGTHSLIGPTKKINSCDYGPKL